MFAVTEVFAVDYRVELLPVKVAEALPAFIGKLPAGESTFASHDLMIGRDAAAAYLLAVAERANEAGQPIRVAYVHIVEKTGGLVVGSNDALASSKQSMVEGGVLRAVLVGMDSYRNAASKTPLDSIGWRSTDKIVTVMFVPARVKGEEAVIGGATSLGKEIHYHVDRETLKVVRTSFAR